MKRISVGLMLLLACALTLPAVAQTKSKKKRTAKTATAQTTKKDDRVVSANPVIEGDPDVPDDRITIQQLKAKMDASANILILDVRSIEGWKTGTTKIKGSIRVAFEDVDKKMTEWKKTQEIIAYCS